MLADEAGLDIPMLRTLGDGLRVPGLLPGGGRYTEPRERGARIGFESNMVAEIGAVHRQLVEERRLSKRDRLELIGDLGDGGRVDLWIHSPGQSAWSNQEAPSVLQRLRPWILLLLVCGFVLGSRTLRRGR